MNPELDLFASGGENHAFQHQFVPLRNKILKKPEITRELGFYITVQHEVPYGAQP